MKKILFICCIAISALALSTSARAHNYKFARVNSGYDTAPPMMSDTMHHGAMKMHNNRKGMMMKDSASGMNMRRDSTSTVPPKR